MTELTDKQPDRLPWGDHASHPEELTADYEFRLGDLIHLRARARCTPAGLVTAGIAVALIILAVGRARR
ncbi:hypothetical protein FJQ54_06840 [Sandaracinobacter neustonicus]|uniref:Uncharacterized protein n=1 Tax=Sandaracinobacter neustonicus TaxID=1715348 RepID=A0A501XNY1_9SPHN|nr:hypothetical protein [Sandaracinobacter neustonicus]TPE62240.1 hypothetical protein FJQ54_06840 [Sandaracinobacter neustonicus]